MATATFANPWHDEVGKFAPKGTGRKFGGGEWQDGRLELPDGHVAVVDKIGFLPGYTWHAWEPNNDMEVAHGTADTIEAGQAAAEDALTQIMPEPKMSDLQAQPVPWQEKSPGVWFGDHVDGWRAAYDRDAMPPEKQTKFDEAFPNARYGWERNVNVFVPGVKNSGKVLSGTAKSLADAKAKAEKAGQAEIDKARAKYDENMRRITGQATIGEFMNPWHDEIGRFAPKGTGRSFGASQGEMRSLFDPVRPLVDVLEAAGGKTYLVGGSVRDRLLGIDAKDIDIEVHGMPVEDTIALLEDQGARVDEVGKAFGVLKVTYNGETHDFSFPRTEVKTGEGHTGFDITVDPNLGIEQALARRDFTMNALAVDSDGNLVDPFNGVDDLRNGILRAASPAFSEDPLRILRGVQFAGRMGLHFDPATAKLARGLLPELETVHENRVWGEFEKLGQKAVSMEAATQAMKDVGLDSRYGQVDFTREPDLAGLSGDHRAAVALASIGIDPVAIGAPRTVARTMADVYTALDFNGDAAASRTAARDLKFGTFADAARIAGPNDNVDPRVLNGPLPPLVTGNDVMARGVRGPAIGEVLRRVAEAQDADTIGTRQEALDWLDKHAATSVRRAAEFANPWHDEIGRFAPKGTGTAVEVGGDRGYDEYVKYIDDPFNSPNAYWGGMSFDDPRKDAFYSYFQGHAEPMNAWLRGVGEASEPERKWVKNLGELIDSAGGVKSDIVVFRGLNKGTLPDLNPGDEITDPGFMSTSFSRKVAARGRAGMDTEVLEITAPEGTKAMMGYAGMDEVIVQRGTTLRVDDVSEEGGQKWIKATIVNQQPGSSTTVAG